MLNNLISIDKYRIKPGTDISLKDFDTEYKEDIINKEEGENYLKKANGNSRKCRINFMLMINTAY